MVYSSSSSSREVKIQDKLIEILKGLSKKYRFNGLEISNVERDHPIIEKKVDIAVFLKGMFPFIY